MADVSPCTVDDCPNPQLARGWCSTHYARWRRIGSTDLPARVQATCGVDGCGRPVLARSLCATHYKRWERFGAIDLPPRRADSHSAHLRNVLGVLPTDACVPWPGEINRTGYGLVRYNERRKTAHRRVYEITIGPVPDVLHLDHLCHNSDLSCVGGPACMHRRCVNPAHLEPVTPWENDARARARPTYASSLNRTA